MANLKTTPTNYGICKEFPWAPPYEDVLHADGDTSTYYGDWYKITVDSDSPLVSYHFTGGIRHLSNTGDVAVTAALYTIGSSGRPETLFALSQTTIVSSISLAHIQDEIILSFSPAVTLPSTAFYLQLRQDRSVVAGKTDYSLWKWYRTEKLYDSIFELPSRSQNFHEYRLEGFPYLYFFNSTTWANRNNTAYFTPSFFGGTQGYGGGGLGIGLLKFEDGSMFGSPWYRCGDIDYTSSTALTYLQYMDFYGEVFDSKSCAIHESSRRGGIVTVPYDSYLHGVNAKVFLLLRNVFRGTREASWFKDITGYLYEGSTLLAQKTYTRAEVRGWKENYESTLHWVRFNFDTPILLELGKNYRFVVGCTYTYPTGKVFSDVTYPLGVPVHRCWPSVADNTSLRPIKFPYTIATMSGDTPSFDDGTGMDDAPLSLLLIQKDPYVYQDTLEAIPTTAFPFTYGITPGVDVIDTGMKTGYYYNAGSINDSNDLFFRFVSPAAGQVVSYLQVQMLERSIPPPYELSAHPGWVPQAWCTLHRANNVGGIGTMVGSSVVIHPSSGTPDYPEELSFSLPGFPVGGLLPQVTWAKGEVGFIRFYTNLPQYKLLAIFNGVGWKTKNSTSIPRWSIGTLLNDGSGLAESNREAAAHLAFQSLYSYGSPWKSTVNWQNQTQGTWNYDTGTMDWNPDDLRGGIWNNQWTGGHNGRLDWKRVSGGQITLPAKATVYSATVKMFVPRYRNNMEFMPIKDFQAHLFQDNRFIASSSIIPFYAERYADDDFWTKGWAGDRDRVIDWMQFSFSPLVLEAETPYQLIVQATFITGTENVTSLIPAHWWNGSYYPDQYYIQKGWVKDFQHDDPSINAHYYYDNEDYPYNYWGPVNFNDARFFWRGDQYPAVSRLTAWSTLLINKSNPFRFPYIYGELDTSASVPTLTSKTVEPYNDAGISLSLEWDQSWNYESIAASRRRRSHGS